MKSTGIYRQLDSLGRIVLPIELRRSLEIGPKDMLQISVEDDQIVLRRFEPNCLFCGSSHGLVSYRDRMLCRECAKEIGEL